MSLPEAYLPTPQTVLYLGNVALAVLWSCAAALLAALACRRRSAPTRCTLLLLGLVFALTSPASVWLAGWAGAGWLRVTLSEQRVSPSLRCSRRLRLLRVQWPRSSRQLGPRIPS